MNSKIAHTISELENIHKYVDDILTHIDDESLVDLMGGTNSDVNKMIEILIEETSDVILNQKDAPIKNASLDYLDNLTRHVEETFRINNFNYFVLSVLPTFDINWHHVEWGNLIQLYKWLCVIAARDHSKSFSFSKAYPLWKLYRYTAKQSFSRVPKELSLSKQGILITNEYNLAKHHLAQIRDEIEGNHILHAKLYPEGKRSIGWGKEEIKCKNGASLIVKSYGSKMRGYHPGYIIVDDFLNESCLYSSDQRNKYIDMFHSVIMNMIVPGGDVKVVGTPFHQKDLYADLKSKKRWAVFEYPAIMPDGGLLWAARHNYQSIMDKRESQGSIIFSREILVRPVSSDSTIFPYNLVEKSFIGMDKYTLCVNRQSHPMKFKKVATGCDFAASANVGADYSVFMTLGIDDLNNYWLLDIVRLKGASYSEQLARIKQINRDWRPDIICMESNAMQTLFVDGAKQANLPILEHHTGKNKYDLKSGLPGMAILFEHNRFRFPRGDQRSVDLTDWLALELSSITWTDKGLQGAGEHDDGPMSLWKGVVGLNYVNSSFDFLFI